MVSGKAPIELATDGTHLVLRSAAGDGRMETTDPWHFAADPSRAAGLVDDPALDIVMLDGEFIQEPFIPCTL